jgi:hypothetical protein
MQIDLRNTTFRGLPTVPPLIAQRRPLVAILHPPKIAISL